VTDLVRHQNVVCLKLAAKMASGKARQVYERSPCVPDQKHIEPKAIG
jgi:hypothetical protein